MSEANGQPTAQLETEAKASTESTEQLKILKHLFIVGGEKGGVGKTWFTYILIELLLQLDLDPTILDLDKTTPNVAKAYLKDIYHQWSATNIQALQVFELKKVGKIIKLDSTNCSLSRYYLAIVPTIPRAEIGYLK
jgi:cellulose biosynthesis protein BcsQ